MNYHDNTGIHDFINGEIISRRCTLTKKYQVFVIWVTSICILYIFIMAFSILVEGEAEVL